MSDKSLNSNGVFQGSSKKPQVANKFWITNEELNSARERLPSSSTDRSFDYAAQSASDDSSSDVIYPYVFDERVGHLVPNPLYKPPSVSSLPVSSSTWSRRSSQSSTTIVIPSVDEVPSPKPSNYYKKEHLPLYIMLVLIVFLLIALIACQKF